MFAQNCARAYRSNAVLTAGPGQLVLLLLDGALRSLAQAREGFSRPEEDPRRCETINQHLLKAQRIITELQDSLNMEKGGEFAQTMQRLYDYYNRRLFEANMRKTEAPVVEVERLIGEIRGAWAEMLRQRETGGLVPAAQGVA